MSGSSQREPSYRYLIHGVSLSIVSQDPVILAGIDNRLRLLPTAPASPADIRFTFGAELATLSDVAELGDRVVYDAPGARCTYRPASDELLFDCAGALRARCLPKTGEVTVALGSSDWWPRWLATHLVFTLALIETLKRRGLFGLHAAGLASADTGVLIAGASGAGKSTTALALLRAGFGFLGDDLVLLRCTAGRVEACAFPDEVGVSAWTASRFPELRHLAMSQLREGDTKHQIRPETVYPMDLRWIVEPSIILFPQVVDRPDSSLEPMTPESVLAALAAGILRTDVASSQAQLDCFALVASSCRSYRLALGQDLGELPDLVRSVTDTVG